MSAPGGFLPDVIIFVPVRFVPPSTKGQATFEQYIPVRTGASRADIKAAAEDRLRDLLANLITNRYRPAAEFGQYRIDILPITAIPRASSGQRGY